MSTESSALTLRARIHAALGEPARLAIVDTLTIGDVSPSELARSLALPTNLIAHHLNVLEEAGVLTRVKSEGDRRRTYLQLIPAALSLLIPPSLPAAPRIVFVCTHNSARSQLAAALWANRSPIPATSAGIDPAKRVHPRAIRVARRRGLTIQPARTAHIDDVLRDDDLVIAVCDAAHEHLPVTPRRLHWAVPDPAAADNDDAFEAAYADLEARIDRLVPVVQPQERHHD
jgi:protein-tyrosine-phosphatase/DNA-binding transcriptional ArsR family regulator